MANLLTPSFTWAWSRYLRTRVATARVLSGVTFEGSEIETMAVYKSGSDPLSFTSLSTSFEASKIFAHHVIPAFR